MSPLINAIFLGIGAAKPVDPRRHMQIITTLRKRHVCFSTPEGNDANDPRTLREKKGVFNKALTETHCM